MKIEEFVTDFFEQFDDTDISFFKPETEFKELDEWSSMIALCVIAMVDENYGVKIKGEDIKQSTTINDLFELVREKIK